MKQLKRDPFTHPGRYFVPDLTPEARPELKKTWPRAVFVAESPHISEIAPDTLAARRPLCGKAGSQWWGALTELLDGQPSADVSLEELLKICRVHRVGVLNAVQYPLDPKVGASFPEADPAKTVGFSKAPGPSYYKKMKATPELKRALHSLRERLDDPAIRDCPVYCLGNDSEWFVSQALGVDEFKRRVRDRIPHPSAWWRKGGFFGRVAREKLQHIFKA